MTRLKKQKKQEKEKLSKFEVILEYLTSSAFFLFLFVTSIIVFTSVWFITSGTIFRLLLPTIYIISIVLYCFVSKSEENKKKIISIATGTLVFIVATLISSKIYDMTPDGTTYHKLAVGAMKNGWNPVWEDISNFNKDKGNPFDIYKDNVNVKWVNTYAKGSEIYGATVYSFTKNIDSGKSFNIIFVYIALFISYSILKQMKISTWKAIIISLVIAFNPISITQLTNYYLDGVLSISLFIIILYIMNNDILKNKYNYLILGMSIIWACSVKFTGLAFSGIFCLSFYIYNNYLIIKKEKKFFNKYTIKETIFYSIVVFISIIIVGSSSYTKNLILYGHPLYPLYGKNHVENMVLMEMPKSMQKNNRIIIFAKGIFSKSENSSPSYSKDTNEPEWKIPFTISKGELNNFVSPDLRIGGFGYFFGGVFIISIIGIIKCLIHFYKNNELDKFNRHILIILIIFALLFFLDGGYWARYIPYVYMIPVFVLINNYSKKDQYKYEKLLSSIISLFLILDSILILGVQFRSVQMNRKYIYYHMNDFVKYSRHNKNVNIKLNHHGVQGVQYNLDDLKINNYTVVEDESKIKEKKDGYMFIY